MSAPDFLDTSVVVYALDVEVDRKHNIARMLLDKALDGECVISTQVLAELSSILLHKYSPQFTVPQVMEFLDSLRSIPLIQPDAELVRRAVEAHGAYGVRFYDGMILAAAERAGAKKIWSEDLSAGQKYFGIEVANPFQ